MHNTYSDALDALLRDHCQPATVRAIEQRDAAALWQALLESGFADCLLPESADGAGLPLSDLRPCCTCSAVTPCRCRSHRRCSRACC